MLEFLKFMGWIFGAVLGISIVIVLSQWVYGKVPEKWKEPLNIILGIAGIILFFWLADYLITEHYKNKENGIYEQLSRVCGVITEQQPQNIDLYDDCMNRGMEEFSPSTPISGE